MSSTSRVQLESWLKTVEVKNGRILDIGGSAGSIKNRLKSFQAKEYLILDNNNEEKLHEKWTQSDIVQDINKILFKFMEEYFDVVFMIEVSEYLTNPSQAFDNIFNMLKKGGKFYFSTHFVYPVHHPIKDDCLRFTKYGVVKLLKEAGFKERNIEVIPRYAERPKELLNLYNIERMRVAKEENHTEIGHMWEVKK